VPITFLGSDHPAMPPTTLILNLILDRSTNITPSLYGGDSDMHQDWY